MALQPQLFLLVLAFPALFSAPSHGKPPAHSSCPGPLANTLHSTFIFAPTFVPLCGPESPRTRTRRLLDPFPTRRMARLLRDTFSFGMWEWGFRNHSTVDSQTLGLHSSGITTQLNTGELIPHPEGALGTLLLWSPPARLNTGHMNAVNIQPSQMYTMCTMPPDTLQRGDFTKQASTGTRNQHITGHCVSHWNTVPQVTDCLNQLSSGQTNSSDTWPTRNPQTTNLQTWHNTQKFSPQNRAPSRNPRSGSLLIPFDTGQMNHTNTGWPRSPHTSSWPTQFGIRQERPENTGLAKCEETTCPASQLSIWKMMHLKALPCAFGPGVQKLSSLLGQAGCWTAG